VLRQRLQRLFDQKMRIRSAGAALAGALALLTVALADMTVSQAEAQSATCTRLERQLASLGASGNKASAAKYRRAIKAQNRQISKVNRKMNGYGCTQRKKLFSREAHPSCRGLRSTLRSMKSNVKSLQRRANGFSNGSSYRRQKRRIQRAMARNRCGQPDTRRANVKRTEIFDQIFGKNARSARRRQAEADRQALLNDRKKQKRRSKSTEDRLRNYNTIRTVCVRRCDGYHFPVSFSTQKSGLARDGEACDNLCPGTEMELFYHKTTGQSTQDMISTIDGQPYTSLPNAFAYKESFDPTCSCNYRLLKREKPNLKEKIDPKGQRARDLKALARIALPKWRVDPDQDPETLANANTDLEKKPLETIKTDKDNEQVVQNRRVRVIGREFLPVQ